MSLENRNVTLYCPTCGNDLFSAVDSAIDDLSDAPDDTKLQCADCKSIFIKQELIDCNQDLINANIEDIKNEAIKELEKSLKKFFI